MERVSLNLMSFLKNNQTLVIVPIYKNKFEDEELFSLEYSLNKLRQYEVFFFGPEDLDFKWYERIFSTSKFMGFSVNYFKSHSQYNQLCYEIEFYEKFNSYEYLLLLQPDAIIIKDEVERWTSMNFDFIGGPEKNKYSYDLAHLPRYNQLPFLSPIVLNGCNGGLSLRKTDSFIRLLTDNPEISSFFRGYGVGIGEDIFYSVMGKVTKNFLVPNEVICSEFALAHNYRNWLEFNNWKIPMGFHGWYNDSESESVVRKLIGHNND